MSLKFAVVIPAKNAARFIETAIASAIGQSHRPEVVVVVENGSTDGTLKIARRVARQAPDRIIVASLLRANTANARNFGIQRAIDLVKPDAIAFLDADDFWHRDKLKCEAQVFRANPCIGLAYSFSDFVSIGGDSLFRGNEIPYEGFVFEDLFKRFFLENGSSFSVRAFIFKLFPFKEPFNPLYTCAADLDFCLRVSNLSPFGCTKSVGTYYRQHTQQATRTCLVMQRSCSIAILRKHAKFSGAEHLLPEAIERVEQYIEEREGERRAARRLANYGV